MSRHSLYHLCLMASIMANAQYRVSTVDKQETENIKLLQVLEASGKVLICGTSTSPKA